MKKEIFVGKKVGDYWEKLRFFQRKVDYASYYAILELLYSLQTAPKFHGAGSLSRQSPQNFRISNSNQKIETWKSNPKYSMSPKVLSQW